MQDVIISTKPAFLHALPLAALAPYRLPIALGLLVLAALHAGFTILEQVSIIRMDAWIPLQSMEEAEWYTLIISAAAQAIRIALVGGAVWIIARPLARAASTRVSAIRFFGFWLAVSMAIGVATLALDGVGYWLQFSGMAMDGTTFRWSFLGLIYAKLLASAVLVSLLFGAGAFAAAPTVSRPAAGLGAPSRAGSSSARVRALQPRPRRSCSTPCSGSAFSAGRWSARRPLSGHDGLERDAPEARLSFR
jgi:hypothetical protein